MSVIIVGCDPGLTGALCALSSDGSVIALEDMPIIRDGRNAWIDADTLASQLLAIRAGHQLHAYCERVHAMPRNGSQAAFSQGSTLGSLLATLQLVRASIQLITPSSWKKPLGLSSDKSASLDRARLLYPDASLDRKKDHNRAEAILIAHYALKHTRGSTP